jgi:zinc D-Ala-D-Ala dipeptidase
MPSKQISTPEIPDPYRDLLSRSSQAVVVTTPGWNSVDGTLTRYEKKDGHWQPVRNAIPVVVGKNGLAWDGAIDANWNKSDPVKKEGDGRSPAGILRLVQAFGFDASSAGTNLPYLALKDSTECVDDASSNAYSKIMDRDQTANPDWNSAEKMRTVSSWTTTRLLCLAQVRASSCTSGRGRVTGLPDVLQWMKQS